jgi:hypothetical protein
MIADAFDCRKLLLIWAVILFLSTTGLLALAVVESNLSAVGQHVLVWPFCVFTTIGAMAGIAIGATRSAIVPRIVSRELVAPASAIIGLSIGAQFMVGPALAGVPATSVGFEWTFVVDMVLSAAAFLGIALLPALPPLSNVVRLGWTSLKQSVRFLRGVPQNTSGFLADIFALTFDRPYVLLPAVAAGLIGGGPITIGLVMSAVAPGTFLTVLFSGPVKHVRHQGMVIGRSSQVFGLFVVLFGVVLLLVSLDVLPPPLARWYLIRRDERYRARFAVVNGGPRLGNLYGGICAALVALWFPPLLGGFLIVVAIGLNLRLTPSLRNDVFEGATPR